MLTWLIEFFYRFDAVAPGAGAVVAATATLSASPHVFTLGQPAMAMSLAMEPTVLSLSQPAITNTLSHSDGVIRNL